MGDYGAFDPDAYHVVYGYASEDLPPYGGFSAPASSIDMALGQAQLLAANPDVIMDMCRLCRIYDWGVSFPRWNIHRGENHLPRFSASTDPPPRILPAFFYDIWNLPPYPGYPY
jgi:hypothetical protein